MEKTPCAKCEELVKEGDGVVAVIRGTRTFYQSELGVNPSGEPDVVAHECCWDGIADQEWDTGGIDPKNCEHLRRRLAQPDQG